MKRIIALLLILIMIAGTVSFAEADSKVSGKSKGTSKNNESEEYYVIGDSQNTFNGLHKKMCVNLDLKKHPLPKPDTELGDYSDGEYEYAKIMKDDDVSYEYIGYVRTANDKNLYIVRSWTGYHEDGSLIGMDVYYTLYGYYLGNIQRDYSAGTSTSSHNCPYFIPGEPMNKA